MTNKDFINFQTALGLSGKELADKLGVTPSSISGWRGDRPVPDYIAKAMEALLQEIEIHLPLNVLVQLSRAADARGIPLDQFITQAIRAAATSAPPANVTPLYPDGTEDRAQRIAEDTNS